MIQFVIVLFAVSAYALPSTRIIGGYYASLGQLPYQVSVRRYESHHCGGAIVNEKTVISAAHCYSQNAASDFTVVTGSTVIDNTGDFYNVKEIRLHYMFEPISMQNDIAIMKLKLPIKFNNNVKAIQLGDRIVQEKTSCVVSGWGQTESGYTEHLKYLHMYTISNENCQKEWPQRNIFDFHICTFTRFGEGTCLGDSGGPLAIQNQLIGVVSFGRPCAVGIPDVFTRISSYIPWIYTNWSQ